MAKSIKKKTPTLSLLPNYTKYIKVSFSTWTSHVSVAAALTQSQHIKVSSEISSEEIILPLLPV